MLQRLSCRGPARCLANLCHGRWQFIRIPHQRHGWVRPSTLGTVNLSSLRRWRLIWYLIGEDRWLCTLMVQSGWRLEYCAAAEDSTYCPDNFDEFYKQRRRWIPSTLANLILLISEWNVIAENNDGISFFFILYQALMVFSTIIRLVSKTP